MAYCTECGTYLEDYDSNCPGCGQSFFLNTVSNTEPALLESEPIVQSEPNLDISNVSIDENPAEDFVNDQAEVKPEIELNPRSTLEANENIGENYQDILTNSTMDDSFVSQEMTIINQSRVQEDSHLGKGIIKPQKIEVDNEGIHFKYDMPAHSFIKNEPIKEKPTEFRITAAEMETKDFNELFQVNEPPATEPPEPIQVDISEEANSELAEEESTPETEPELNTEVEPAQVINEELVIESTQGEVISEETFPEPVIPEVTPTKIIWEGRETWYRIPLVNQYQITNRTLVIFDRYNNHILEIPLTLITGAIIQSSWFAKLFNIGNLIISIRDFSAPKVILGGIIEPSKVKRQLEIVCECKL